MLDYTNNQDTPLTRSLEMAIRLVSFDLDGTLVNSKFVDLVWMEGVPRLYGKRHGVDFTEQRRRSLAST